MKKMKELMEALGFNKDASDGAKKAFINHLIREAHFQDLRRNPNAKPLQILSRKSQSSEIHNNEEQQLSFPLASSDDP
ncbi:MAG: hypothetical protein K2Q26_07110 [Bdellovibrionales bacterium]|nr:hypothetical protein [Bdellovibrionales bacterium]